MYLFHIVAVKYFYETLLTFFSFISATFCCVLVAVERVKLTLKSFIHVNQN